MGWIQEIADLFGKLAFYKIVHEYEQGLYFRAGRVQERRLPKRALKPKDLEKILDGEKTTYKTAGGFLGFLPFRRPALPKGYRRDWVAGRPLHPDRYSKVLQPRLYFHIPLIDDIVTDSNQEAVLNCPFATVPTIDPETSTIAISCNIRYEVSNFYLAYTAVHDYKLSLRDHALSILALKSMGKTIEQWKDPAEIRKLGEAVEQELRKIVTEKWGIKIHQVYITDVVPAKAYKILDGGPSPPTQLILQQELP